ncbi:MAG TPA: MauE/DoxX family redox-associated membrane protein [Acidimicrobiia bacterium]|nr:MauE/DoxX family redox-associated membrane protein [Acidimicrobiia bacterium]
MRTATLPGVLEAWFFIAAALLVVSGGSKLWDPAPTRGALVSSGLPSGPWTAPALGIAEILAGLAGTLVGGWASLTVAAIYLAFAGFVAYALLRKIPLQSCGCFGRTDTPPTWGHLVFNVVSAGAAVGVSVVNSAPFDLLADQPLWGLPYLGFVALGVWVVYLLLAELPQLAEAGR